jgi:hypothetical protein
MNQIIDAFCNPENVARYTDGPTRMVHGYAGFWPSGFQSLGVSWCWAPVAGLS